MNDRIEKALLYKCLVCSKIFGCWWEGIHSCGELERCGMGDNCPKRFPHILKDFSSGLCPEHLHDIPARKEA